jgi:serine/threonine-protein kinase
MVTSPRTLGRYDVLAPLGGGGMATIYLGRARGAGEQRAAVALKVIKQELAGDKRYIDMFHDEARLLVKLTHPNIIRTLEAGIEGDHTFIAMELLLGKAVADLSDELTRRGEHIPYPLAAWIGARVADALHYAHELTDDDGVRLDLVHRDVNPTNIMATYDGGVKLIDFGLAKSARRRSRSQEGIIKGKVPYLSPEQIGQRDVDHRSDLYTLGATLWEMTTGRRLWKRDTDLETVRAIAAGVVPDPTSFMPGYPEELWAIVWESLLPQSDDRFKDAAAMARDLDAFVAGSKGSRAGMGDELAGLLERAFPGEREKREAWVRDAMGQQDPTSR